MFLSCRDIFIIREFLIDREPFLSRQIFIGRELIDPKIKVARLKCLRKSYSALTRSAVGRNPESKKKSDSNKWT